jgi:hypothetical protein
MATHSSLAAAPEPLRPVLVRPAGSSPLAAATAVPACAATGRLALRTLRRYFPAASALHYTTATGLAAVPMSPAVPLSWGPQATFLLPDPAFLYIVSFSGPVGGWEEANMIMLENTGEHDELHHEVKTLKKEMEDLKKEHTNINEITSAVEDIKNEIAELKKDAKQRTKLLEETMNQMEKIRSNKDFNVKNIRMEVSKIKAVTQKEFSGLFMKLGKAEKAEGQVKLEMSIIREELQRVRKELVEVKKFDTNEVDLLKEALGQVVEELTRELGNKTMTIQGREEIARKSEDNYVENKVVLELVGEELESTIKLKARSDDESLVSKDCISVKPMLVKKIS